MLDYAGKFTSQFEILMLIFSNSIALGAASELAHNGTNVFQLSQMLFNPPVDTSIRVSREDVTRIHDELIRVLNAIVSDVERLRQELPENLNDLCAMKFVSN